MRFHLVDCVDAWVAGRSIRARKLTSHAESYWMPGGPALVMPQWLVLEAICQAGSCLLMLSTEGRKRAALLGVERVEFSGEVHPGDVLQLTGEVSSLDDEAALFSGTASVDGKLIARASEILCAQLDAEQLEDPESAAVRIRTLTRGLQAGGSS